MADIPVSERPINQHWSWDRILRSIFIKQADVLQGLNLFEDHFDLETLRENFDFYEPKTVNESSTFFGLPKQVVYCKKCVVSNQRPNSAIEFKHTIESKKTTILFDENGVCDACNFAVKKNTNIDWNQREKQLFAN